MKKKSKDQMTEEAWKKIDEENMEAAAEIDKLHEQISDLKAIIKAYRSARDFWFEKHIKLERKHRVKSNVLDAQGDFT